MAAHWTHDTLLNGDRKDCFFQRKMFHWPFHGIGSGMFFFTNDTEQLLMNYNDKVNLSDHIFSDGRRLMDLFQRSGKAPAHVR